MWHAVGPIPRPAYLTSPPAPRRWVWFVIGAGSGLAFGLIALMFIGFLVSLGEGFDDGYDEDGYYVEQGSVERAVDQPCVEMKDAASKLVLIGDVEASVASLKAFTATIGPIVTAIDGAKPDSDAKAWRDDWVELAASLDAYAAKVAAGDETAYKMPRSSSSGPITTRMYDGSPAGCEVPTRIDMLDPKVADDFDDLD